MEYTFFRIHTNYNNYKTNQPEGIYVAIWRLVDKKILNEDEIRQYWEMKKYYEEVLPIPPFYKDKNAIKAVTWFKTNGKYMEISDKFKYYIDIAKKYKIKLIKTYTNDPGDIIYEDEFQVGIVNSKYPNNEYKADEI